jgi:oligopeptide transport system substrate-binding protein
MMLLPRRVLRTVPFVALLLAGCGGSVVVEPGVLQVGNGAEVQNLDPHLVSGVTEHRVLTSIFEGLVDMDPATMQPVPATAESWTVSPDGLRYTFKIRPTAKWSNGDLVTAHDFVYAWHRMLSPKLATEYGYFLHCIKNAKPFNLGTLSDFSEVGAKALDDATLAVVLENPTPYFLGMQIHFAWFPVHRATIEAFGEMDERDTQWARAGNHVGNGAFQLAAWYPSEFVRVEANPHYWNAANLRLKGIVYHPISNIQTEERAFRAGDLHLTSIVPLHKVAVYQEKYPDLIHIEPYCGSYYYRLNVTKPPLDDKRVRQALSLALDRESLAAHVLKGGELPATHFTPPNTAGYTAKTQVDFDVDRARALLAEAGYPNGEGLPPIEILYNTSEDHKIIAVVIQSMWKKNLNIDVQLMNQDWKVYLSSMNTLDYQVARSAWIADVLDPINFLECFLSGSGNNRTGFNSPDYDRLINTAYAEADVQRREGLLQKAEAILLDEMAVIPIYFYVQKYLKAPEVKGLVSNSLGYIRWTDLYFEDGEK